MEQLLFTVILAGGSGTRFWPLSREMHPKQLMTVFENRSMFRMTVERALALAPAERARIVTISSQIQEITTSAAELGINKDNILEEPSGRNTAAAIGLAVSDINNPDAVIAVLPSDHFIKDEQALVSIIKKASIAAAQDWIVALGITPTRPETGYGYLRRGTRLEIHGAGEIFAAAQFVEKPDLEKAGEYMRSEEYFWNSGMFIFRAGRFMSELKRFLPGHYEALEELKQTDKKSNRPGYEHIYQSMERVSVDYGIMERADRVAVIPAKIGWSDVGSWKALYDILDKNGEGNVLHGDAEAIGSGNSLVWSEKRLVAALGMENTAIIETPDAVLVCPLHRSQEVRSVAERLLKLERKEAISPYKFIKPWGSYTILEQDENYQVKRIEIKQGKRLSLQSHEFRSEHWTVIEGTANVIIDGNKLELTQGSDVCIPRRAKHRVENRGEGILRIIEVQTGSYLGEDDIIRYEDDYGRAG